MNIVRTGSSAPAAFKFWPKLYRNQQYIYVGVKYSFNLSVTTVQTVSWEEAAVTGKIDAEQFRRSNVGFFLGFNYLAFNIQLDYVPGNLFNMDYIDETVSSKPLYLGQPDKMFFISTSINTPLNGWLGTKSIKIKRFFKKIKFWR